MRDRRSSRALAAILTIRVAEHAVAQQELVLAGERERDAEIARVAADARLGQAADDWQLQLAAGGFQPELSSAFAAQLVSRAEEARIALASLERSTDEVGAREIEWRGSDARHCEAEKALRSSLRARARNREDHALDALADCTAYRWSRA